MMSLQKTVMVYVTILLVIMSVAAATVSYFFVKGEVNSFQDNALQEVALNAGLVYRHDIQPHIDAELEDQLVVQIWDHFEKPVHRSGPPVEIPAQAALGYSDDTAGGERWRVFRARDSQHFIQISQRWSAREEVASYAAAGAVIPLIASIPLAWLLIGWAVKRVLRGLGDLSADIGCRSADARGALRLTGVPAEFVPLVGAMNSLIERQQQALETQRRFVSDAAHELRTPLAALQIQIDNMRAQDITGGAREIADDLLGGIRRATCLTNQLLLLARADASMESELAPIQAGVLIQMVASPLASIAAAKGLRLETDIAENIPVTVRASEVQLVLSNLLDNAVRYTKHGGLVRIEAKRAGDNLEIEITDTGCGIPEAALPRLYERFFRAAPLDIEGTGLGLAIARTTADRNGLQMEIRNRGDVQGVIATLTIPLRVPEPVPA